MLFHVLATLLIVKAVCSQESANLRGNAEESKRELVSAAKGIRQIQGGHEAYVNKIFTDLRTKLKAKVVASEASGTRVPLNDRNSALNYEGGNPQLTYNGYFVSRFRSNGDCSGPGKLLLFMLVLRYEPRFLI
jgi:hypothetical protein